MTAITKGHTYSFTNPLGFQVLHSWSPISMHLYIPSSKFQPRLRRTGSNDYSSSALTEFCAMCLAAAMAQCGRIWEFGSIGSLWMGMAYTGPWGLASFLGICCIDIFPQLASSHPTTGYEAFGQRRTHRVFNLLIESCGE